MSLHRRHVVLLVISTPDRLHRHHHALRAAHYHVLPTQTLEYALILIGKVNPSAVAADIALDDGRALALVQALRVWEKRARIPVFLLGDSGPDEHAHVQRDPHVRVHPADDVSTLVAALGTVLAAA